jgi:hypothetical protein
VFIDLPVIDAQGLTAEQISTGLLVHADELDGAVVRQRVLNLSRLTQRTLDWKAIAGLKARTLHYQLATERPADEAPTLEHRARTRQRLEEMLDDFLGARVIPPDVDRAEMRALGREYLTTVDGE